MKKEAPSAEKDCPGYRVFPVAWRMLPAVEVGEISIGSEDSCPAMLVNLDQKTVRFSVKRTGHGQAGDSRPLFALLPLHFCVLGSDSCELVVDIPGKMVLIEFDTLPGPPDRFEGLVEIHSVPSAALSLIESLAGESCEIPLALLVRTLIDLLSPSLFDGIDEDELADFRNYISRHLGEPISTEDIASALGLSTGRLRELTRDAIDMTPVAYLRQERIRLSRDLLATTSINIDQIAERTGYSDRFAFTRAFTAATGVSPIAYRESKMGQRIKY